MESLQSQPNPGDSNLRHRTALMTNITLIVAELDRLRLTEKAILTWLVSTKTNLGNRMMLIMRLCITVPLHINVASKKSGVERYYTGVLPH